MCQARLFEERLAGIGGHYRFFLWVVVTVHVALGAGKNLGSCQVMCGCLCAARLTQIQSLQTHIHDHMVMSLINPDRPCQLDDMSAQSLENRQTEKEEVNTQD